MSKVKPTTKEQLIYYMLQNISLGTYDKKLLTNLCDNNIMGKKPVTSNQADLLSKVTLRYARQLRKHEIDATEMTNLSWDMEIIESIPEYTDAYCTIKDGQIEVRSPYKKEFIVDYKKAVVPVTWNRDTRMWSSPYCEYSLKHAIDCLDKHYQVVRYCPETTKIINNLADFEGATCWNPTLKKVNGLYLIAGVNKFIYEKIKHLNLDCDPSVIARLTTLGVKIDQEVLTESFEEMWGTDYAKRLVDFASSVSSIINVADIEEMVSFLRDIKCDYVLIAEAFRNSGSAHADTLAAALEREHITFTRVKKTTEVGEDLSEYDFPVVINTALWGYNLSSSLRQSKTVFLGNSSPITIK